MGTLDWASVHDLIDTFSVAVLKCKLCDNFVTTQRDKIITHISDRHTTFQAGMVVITGNELMQESDNDRTLEELSNICEIGFKSWCSGDVQDGSIKTVSDPTLDIISEAALSAQVVSEVHVASVKEVENSEGTSKHTAEGSIHETVSIPIEESIDNSLSPVGEGLPSPDNSNSDDDVNEIKTNDIVTSAIESDQAIDKEKESAFSSTSNQQPANKKRAEESKDNRTVEQEVAESYESVTESEKQDQENPRRAGLRTPGQRRRKVFQDCATEHNLDGGRTLGSGSSVHNRQYKCEQCEFTTERMRAMKGHRLSHADEKSKAMVCSKCNMRFTYKKSLLKHASVCSKDLEKVSGSTQDISDEGVQKDTEDAAIRKTPKRLRKQPPQSPQPCAKCGFICQSETSLKIHMHKHKESRAPRTYACDDCGKKYTTKMGVTRHKLNWCRGDKQKAHVSYTCSFCSKIFQNKMIYHEHLTVHSAIRNHSCDVCSKSFKTHRALQRHATNKHMGVSYKCSLCEFETNWKGSLKTHYVTKHDSESRPLQKCPECPFTTRSALYITKHIMTHRDERPFMCEHCGKSFKADTVLRAHLEQHDDTKRYPCDKCEYIGSSRGALYSHRASHIAKEQMQYKCQLCDWVGRRKTELQVHQRKHSAMKLFRCGHCGQSYKHKHGLTRHLKEKHMVQTSIMQTEVVFPDYEMEYSEDPTLALSSLPVAQFFEISTEILADSS